MLPILLPVTHIQQRKNGECLAACAAMILNYMGLRIDYDRLLKLLRTQWFGTASFHVRELEKLGLTVVYKEGTLDELHEHLSNDRPCIAFVNTGELPYWDEATDHALVIVGLDDDYVYFNDPMLSTAPMYISRGEFILAWQERDEYYAALMRRT